MKHISMHLRKKTTESDDRRTERGELMRYFCDELNPSRIREGMQPISMGRMGRLLQGIPTKDIYYLQTVCKEAKNFSKKFWWELKKGT